MRPDDVTQMAVIGVVVTKVLEMTITTGDKSAPYTMEPEVYKIVSIAEHNGKKFYITNQWHKEYKRIPLIIVEDIVESYTEV
jgi:hypothetical protein